MTVRSVDREDQRLVSSLLATSRWRHAHLDWQDPLDLLGQQPFLVAESDAVFAGCLACPEGPEGVAWIRVLCIGLGSDPAEVWKALWQSAVTQLSAAGIHRAASLQTGVWQRPLLSRSDFRETNAVVFYERSTRRPPPPPPTPASLRTMTSSDLASVVAVDHSAFGPLWRVSPETLEVAYRSAADAAVAEAGGHVVGYQLTTISPLGAHLARLAVTPTWQGRRVGTGLVAGLLQRLAERGVTRITLNTQADNRPGQNLYRRLGFHETGESLPVHEVKW